MKMYSRTAKVLGGIQYTMNSSKTQVNKKIKSLTKRVNNINRRLINNAPVAISTRNSNTGKDYYNTKGKERISNVTALNAAFNIVDIFINPANSSLFPWLSGIAKKYDLYHFKRLRFSYVPSLPTSEEGNVYMGLDYNTLDPPPSDSSELCQLSHWIMNVVWKPSNLSIDLNGIGWLYTRTGPVANADYKTYDIGKLFFATEGINFPGICGYIEVEYDVEFKRRQPDYTSSVVPTTDIFNPLVNILTPSINNGVTASSFTSSYSNNSIFTIDNVTGTFTVNKDIKALVLVASSTGSYHTGAVLVDGSTSMANSVSNSIVTLTVGSTYHIKNNSANESLLVNLIVCDEA